MRIGVQPLQTERLLGEPLAEAFGQALADIGGRLFDLGHGTPGAVLQNQHAGPTEFAGSEGNADAGPAAEVRAEGFEVFTFGGIVQLLADGSLQLGVDRLQPRRWRTEQTPQWHQAAQLAQVRFADRVNAGVLDLHDQRPALAITGAVHLAQRSGRGRRRFDGFEQVVEAAVIQPLQVGFQCGERR